MLIISNVQIKLMKYIDNEVRDTDAKKIPKLLDNTSNILLILSNSESYNSLTYEIEGRIY